MGTRHPNNAFLSVPRRLNSQTSFQQLSAPPPFAATLGIGIGIGGGGSSLRSCLILMSLNSICNGNFITVPNIPLQRESPPATLAPPAPAALTPGRQPEPCHVPVGGFRPQQRPGFNFFGSARYDFAAENDVVGDAAGNIVNSRGKIELEFCGAFHNGNCCCVWILEVVLRITKV